MARGNPRGTLKRSREIVIGQIGDRVWEHRHGRSLSLSPRNRTHFMHSIHRYPCDGSKSSTRSKHDTTRTEVSIEEKEQWALGHSWTLKRGFEDKGLNMETFPRAKCSNYKTIYTFLFDFCLAQSSSEVIDLKAIAWEKEDMNRWTLCRTIKIMKCNFFLSNFFRWLKFNAITKLY